MNQEAGQPQDHYRRLCQLAVDHQVDPEEYRGRLIRAGLERSRASAFKLLLKTPVALTDFLRLAADPQHLGWDKALILAQHVDLAQGDLGRDWPSLSKAERAEVLVRLAQLQLLAKVVGLLHRRQQTSFPVVGGGWLLVRFCAVALQTWWAEEGEV